AGLRLSERGPAAVDKAMQSRTALEREELDRRLAFLGTLGNNAPFIGLFGTVIGVIQAFEELGHSAAGHAGGSGQVASGAVMSAIAEALVATAVGLAVALPAVAAYNYFQRRVEGLLAGAEVLSNLVLAFLSGRDA
ncbi:MAG TPA: MotA/TolQ/ExbB proton channel family protein, partial [Polyangiales bacterium]|nr:MotA/TolQ/ExbB proton channel family protein [Polyangiales bacterium]